MLLNDCFRLFATFEILISSHLSLSHSPSCNLSLSLSLSLSLILSAAAVLPRRYFAPPSSSPKGTLPLHLLLWNIIVSVLQSVRSWSFFQLCSQGSTYFSVSKLDSASVDYPYISHLLFLLIPSLSSLSVEVPPDEMRLQCQLSRRHLMPSNSIWIELNLPKCSGFRLFRDFLFFFSGD